MNETEFHRSVDAALERVERSLDDTDLDVDLEAGILTVTCPDGSRVIVNRQTPNREIWVAARSGGFHFRMKDGEWRDTRSGKELYVSLASVLEEQGGEKIAWK